MDVAPRVDRLLAKAVDEQVSEQRLLREALEQLEDRLARLEETTAALEEKIRPWSDPGGATADLAARVEKRVAKRLDKLESKLDTMADTIEQRAVATVSDELVGATDDLRRAVGEVGRLLVRDRGRISSLLTEHRNAILAELRMPAESPSRDAAKRPLRLDLTEDDLEVDVDLEDAVVEANGRRPLFRRRS